MKPIFSRMDPTTQVDINVKILLIGDSNVGKSWYFLVCFLEMKHIDEVY